MSADRFTVPKYLPRSLTAAENNAQYCEKSATVNAIPRWLLAALVLTYLFPACMAYGPWKPDEPYTFGLVNHLLTSGDWVVPILAGEPFLEKPPLMIWTAAATATLLSPWLDAEYGARAAIPVFLLIAVIATATAARRWWGFGSGRIAVLALLGAAGMVQHARTLTADIPQLTGVSLALLGFAYLPKRGLTGGLLLGTGAGMAFLSKGLLVPGILAVTALAIPALAPDWRHRGYRNALVVAFVAALPWLVVWPLALYLRSDTLFLDWLWKNNIGRFFGFSVKELGAESYSGFMLETLPWFTFPLLPLAAYTCWAHLRQIRQLPGLLVCGLCFAIGVLTLSVSASARAVYLLPLVPPLAILAAPAALRLTRQTAAKADWAARLLFSVLIVFAWVLWWAAFVLKAPPNWEPLTRHLPQLDVLTVEPLALAIAFVLSLLWFGLLPRLTKFRTHTLTSWTSGLVISWAIGFTLLLPWIDLARSYQSTFNALADAMPIDATCLATAEVGESERGMIEYVVGITPERLETHPRSVCNLVLWQSRSEIPALNRSTDWALLWRGARPGERREYFWLFQRPAPPPLSPPQDVTRVANVIAVTR